MLILAFRFLLTGGWALWPLAGVSAAASCFDDLENAAIAAMLRAGPDAAALIVAHARSHRLPVIQLDPVAPGPEKPEDWPDCTGKSAWCHSSGHGSGTDATRHAQAGFGLGALFDSAAVAGDK